MTAVRRYPRPLAWDQAAGPIVVLSLGAAAIHFAVIPEHVAEWWAFGVFFASLAWFQALWPIAYLVRPTPRLTRLAIGINLATIGVWAWSRTMGLPVGPDPGLPEALGLPDTVASTLELLLAVGLASTAARTTEASGQSPRLTGTALGLASVVVIATSVAMAAAQS